MLEASCRREYQVLSRRREKEEKERGLVEGCAKREPQKIGSRGLGAQPFPREGDLFIDPCGEASTSGMMLRLFHPWLACPFKTNPEQRLPAPLASFSSSPLMWIRLIRRAMHYSCGFCPFHTEPPEQKRRSCVGRRSVAVGCGEFLSSFNHGDGEKIVVQLAEVRAQVYGRSVRQKRGEWQDTSPQLSCEAGRGAANDPDPSHKTRPCQSRRCWCSSWMQSQ